MSPAMSQSSSCWSRAGSASHTAPARRERSESGFRAPLACARMAVVLIVTLPARSALAVALRSALRAALLSRPSTPFSSTVGPGVARVAETADQSCRTEARRLGQDVGGQDPRVAIELGADGHSEARQVDQVALGEGRHLVAQEAGVGG